MTTLSEYNHDFYAWAIKNAQLVREGDFTRIDAEHVAEELESMGKSEKRELISRLSVLLSHLLKWEYQPARRTRSWRNTITTQRLDITELLEDSPSLKHEIDRKLERAYEKAILAAEDETGIEKKNFPAICRYSLGKLLEMDFFPDGENVT